jgi:phosphoribosyl 1,2-cyclic phosphodiesterase
MGIMLYNIFGADEMKIMVLASGSRGNSTYLQIGNQHVLMDVGISLRQIQERLSALQLELTRVDAVFITHEHGDHVAGLVTIAKKFQMPIYCSLGTYKNLPRTIAERVDPSLFRFIEFNQPVIFDGFSALPFMTYHDALEPTGYRFTEAGKSLVYMTDTGYFPESRYDLLRNADVYIVESNHEPDLLLDSDRPWLLKKRILDDQGHLSNEDSAFLLMNLLGSNTKKIILAHLSEECNTESHALNTYSRIFQKQGLILEDYSIICAKQHSALPVIDL